MNDSEGGDQETNDPVARGPQHDEICDIHQETESGTSTLHLDMTSSSPVNAMNPVVASSSQTSLVHLPSEPPLKRIKLQGSHSHASLSSDRSLEDSRSIENSAMKDPGDSAAAKQVDAAAGADASSSVISPESKPAAGQPPEGYTAVNNKASLSIPLKATSFAHLSKKYLAELEYMLTEFQKLERQLLGAKAATRESAGSRERREKLHSFILHLQDTITQIHTGRNLEAEGKPTTQKPIDDNSALSKVTQEKLEEENVQKLEEHILANLLPVKVRLKKQLAAQQGAKHNPAGMPVRGSMAVAASQQDKGRATFAAEDSSTTTHFGKPLAGGGSSLTQKLHGPTLGSSNRVHGHGVGSSSDNKKDEGTTKIIFAGMAIGSSQMASSAGAANAAHGLVIKDPALLEFSAQAEKTAEQNAADKESAGQAALDTTSLEAEERRRRMRRKKRKRKKLREKQLRKEKEAKQQSQSKRKNGVAKGGKKRGPRAVEYMCALCNEVYSSTCDYNPWWALTQEECPKCHKTQTPRVDITAPPNAIEYHPALLAHADENAGGGGHAGGGGGVSAMHRPSSHLKSSIAFPATTVACSSESDSLGSDLSNEDWDDDDDDDSLGSDDSDDEALTSLSPADRAENERFGAEYMGPKLSDDQIARLLILMAHASTCPCRHKSAKHRDVCRSTKWMMLHIRDCPGTTSTFDVCPFPWCRKVKHLLYHLVSCQEPEHCSICSPKTLNTNLALLHGLNEHRLKKYRERMIERMKASAAARTKALAAATKPSRPPVGPATAKSPPQSMARTTVATRVPQGRQTGVTKGANMLESGASVSNPGAAATSSVPDCASSTQVAQVATPKDEKVTKPANPSIASEEGAAVTSSMPDCASSTQVAQVATPADEKVTKPANPSIASEEVQSKQIANDTASKPYVDPAPTTEEKAQASDQQVAPSIASEEVQSKQIANDTASKPYVDPSPTTEEKAPASKPYVDPAPTTEEKALASDQQDAPNIKQEVQSIKQEVPSIKQEADELSIKQEEGCPSVKQEDVTENAQEEVTTRNIKKEENDDVDLANVSDDKSQDKDSSKTDAKEDPSEVEKEHSVSKSNESLQTKAETAENTDAAEGAPSSQPRADEEIQKDSSTEYIAVGGKRKCDGPEKASNEAVSVQ